MTATNSRKSSSAGPPLFPTGLSALGAVFSLEYLVDLNASAAYRRCRPAVTDRTAATEGWRLLRNPDVQARIAALTAARTKRLDIKAERVLEELAICGFSDVADYQVDPESGAVTLTGQAHPLATRALQSVKHKTRTGGSEEQPWTEHETEVRLWDKPGSLHKLGQHLKLFNDDAPGREKVKITVDADGGVTIERGT